MKKWLSKFFNSKEEKGKEKKRSKSFFSLPQTDLIPEREEEMLQRMAKRVLDYELEAPAIWLLETIKPLGTMIGQLGLIFVAPFLEFFGAAGYDYAVLFMKEESLERLLKKIEEGLKTSK